MQSLACLVLAKVMLATNTSPFVKHSFHTLRIPNLMDMRITCFLSVPLTCYMPTKHVGTFGQEYFPDVPCLLASLCSCYKGHHMVTLLWSQQISIAAGDD